ncbi:MAG: type III pantothenate kinase [Dehalococcoidales bacterium]|nr:MAG: type III pantothenate kinase [Dehalococcoidales bacterium]
MLLAIDIGNTNITFGIFENDQLRVTWRVATNVDQMPDEYGILLSNLLRHHGMGATDINEIAICSTVSPLTPTFLELCQKYFNITPFVVGAGVKTGVSIHMDNPREVGPDRIANAAAAHHLYSGPTIIVDVGTATTFDVISKDGAFMGGAIATGINTAAEALFRRTAALPRVELVAPKRAIGTNTITAMQSGIIFGFVGLIEGMVNRMWKELGEKPTVVATGGYAHLMAKETTMIDTLEPNITLIGLRLIYLMNNS